MIVDLALCGHYDEIKNIKRGISVQKYYARTNTLDKDKWQPLKEHLSNVAELTGTFAEKFNAKEIGYVTGLLHDIGKYSDAFARRLEGAPVKTVHSLAGAQLARKMYSGLGQIIAYPIAGHHVGLPNYGSKADPASLNAKLNLAVADDYSVYKTEIPLLPSLNGVRLSLKNASGLAVSLFIRLLYSALVDADSLDAEQATGGEGANFRQKVYNLSELKNQLVAYLEKRTLNAPKTLINYYRAEIQKLCQKKAVQKPGLYSLTVPTGGGKTLASLLFALEHAVANNLDRVIYVIPFTSIIEQTAEVFRSVFGDGYVLEHHSNYQFPEESEEWSEAEKRIYFAMENWDAPIIVTTDVQFYESLFSASRSSCRKLHNIVRSVIILDEAQRLPVPYLKPCLAALSELINQYNCTVILCTATQPAIQKYIPGNIVPVELTENPTELYVQFKRVTTEYIGKATDAWLAEQMQKQQRALCIVNTKAHAKNLYSLIAANGAEGVYHLSANMCPVHRSLKLAQIKQALSEKRRCLVVSTQLVEAGVDVSFPVVFREVAGLDSIAQAAGRCNREGESALGRVYVFSSADYKLLGELARTAAIGEMVIKNHLEDPLCLEAIDEYFRELYRVDEERLDAKGILRELNGGVRQLQFEFRDVASKFRLIDDDTVSVIIPFDAKCEKWLEQIKQKTNLREVGRRLQPYTVQLQKRTYSALLEQGAVEMIDNVFVVLKNIDLYSEDIGLKI